MRSRIGPWLTIVDSRGKLTFAVGLAFGFIVSLLEIIGAGVVALSLQLATAGSDRPVHFPLLGDVEALLPGTSRAGDIRWLAALGCVFFIGRGAAVIGQQYLAFRSTYSLSVRLTDRVTENLLARSYSWHLSQNSAELSTLCITVVQTFAVRVFSPMQTVGAQILVVLGLGAVAIAVEPVGAIVAVTAIGSVVAVTIMASRRSLVPLGETELAEAAVGQQLTTEAFQAIREVKLLDLGDSVRARIRESRRRWSDAMRQSATIVAAPRTAMETIAFSALIVLLAYRVSADARSAVAGLGVVGYAVVRILPTANNIVTHVNTIRGAQASVDRLMLALSPKQGDREDKPDARRPASLPVEARGVRYGYIDGIDVLRGIDLTIRPGDSIGLVGSTGCGKSTLLDLLAGLLSPTHGAIELHGVPLDECRSAWWQMIGIVPQNITLLDASLAENIALSEYTSIDVERLERATELARLSPVVAALPGGAATPIGERGLRLSGGQRQRLALARALYRDPAVLFLDEATSALDAETEAAVMANLRADRADRTMVMVAHRVSTLRDCNAILVLEGGVVVAQGTYAELMQTSGHFRRLAAVDDGSTA